MNEPIEFPKNYKTYMKKAVEHIHAGQMNEAIECLEKAYTINQDSTINLLFTTTLSHAGEYERALNIANDMEELYLKDDKRELLYVSILLKNHLFIQSEAIIKRKLKEIHSPYYKEWKNSEKLLVQEREKLEIERKNREIELIKKLYALADLSVEGQLYTVEQAESLPLESLRTIGQVIFGNPFIHLLAKTAFLQYLIQYEDETEYTYEWFDKRKKVTPKSLALFDEDYLVNEVRDELETQLGKNPSLYESLKQEMDIHLMMVYPFVEEVIPSGEVWVGAYRKLYDPLSSELNGEQEDEEEQKVFSWINQLNQKMI